MTKVERAIHGDSGNELTPAARGIGPQVFAGLIAQHDAQLRALAYRMLQDREAMQDAMQDAYLAAYRGLPAFRKEAAVETWLYRIVYTTCLRHLSRRRNAPMAFHDEDLSTPDPADIVALRQDIATAMAHLPLEQRVVVLLVDGHGFSYKAVSEMLGVPSGTVASRLSHGRTELRVALGLASTEEVS